MNTHIEQAVKNNIIWCGIVSESHGIPYYCNGGVWGLLSEAPPLCPDIITAGMDVTDQEVADFIGDRNISTIKDSFANLDMASIGFKVLFNAVWIYHPPVSVSESAKLGWRVITKKEDLTKWTYAHDSEKVIKYNLLDRDDVKIFIKEKEDEISGFIANLGAGVIGISNAFSMEYTNEALWKDIVQAVSTEFQNLPIVGYEQGNSLKAALSCGWESLGPLRIWIR
ncbi:hypothetical protein [Scopulibacillus cellulosilyticus]|uniref:Uncharacterized protein n=1 Tax=Scopulibacillus cellulosilyticus TaxID=2665665 RepID=A0ABW2PPT1_9BACL